MAKYIDVHAHLESARFKDDIDLVVKRAAAEDVLIVQSGTNNLTNRESLEISKKYGTLCSFGIYPIDGIAAEFDGLSDDSTRESPKFGLDSELEWIFEHKDDCVLIGEVGLDFKVVECSNEMKEAQIKNFEKIIEFAKEIGKPILIHSRGAELECIELLEKYGLGRGSGSGEKDSGEKDSGEKDLEAPKGVPPAQMASQNFKSERRDKVGIIMHCFSGKKALIRRCAENGWFMSVPPVITRLQHFETLVGLVPLNQLLTETDSPYLSCVAGKRNEPVNVKVSVKEIARIKELSEDEVKTQIYENAKKLLKI